VRALTREVGSLKEDLRREIKRRERATFSIREAEELKQEAEKRVKQLDYSKRSVVALYHSNSPSSCETTGYAQYKQHAGS
jgi:5-formyltetrahydrofolate cyclo-ligase